jgi:hypothetical protein
MRDEGKSNSKLKTRNSKLKESSLHAIALSARLNAVIDMLSITNGASLHHSYGRGQKKTSPLCYNYSNYLFA